MHQWDANRYSNISNPQYTSGLALIKHIKFDKVRSIVDIGCGTGELTAALSQAVPNSNVLGIDISHAMIKQAQQFTRLLKNIRFKTCDFMHCDLADNTDLVFSNKVIHWVYDHKTLFSKIYTLLNASGQMVVSFGIEGSMLEFRMACEKVGLNFDLLNLTLAKHSNILKLIQGIGFSVTHSEVIYDACNMKTKLKYTEFIETVLLQGMHTTQEERHYWAITIADEVDSYAFNFADISIFAKK